MPSPALVIPSFLGIDPYQLMCTLIQCLLCHQVQHIPMLMLVRVKAQCETTCQIKVSSRLALLAAVISHKDGSWTTQPSMRCDTLRAGLLPPVDRLVLGVCGVSVLHCIFALQVLPCNLDTAGLGSNFIVGSVLSPFFYLAHLRSLSSLHYCLLAISAPNVASCPENAGNKLQIASRHTMTSLALLLFYVC